MPKDGGEDWADSTLVGFTLPDSAFRQNHVADGAVRAMATANIFVLRRNTLCPPEDAKTPCRQLTSMAEIDRKKFS